jgi:hypothetical protein
MSKFLQKDVDDLLVKCHRRCCICHRFCGVKIETDHIDPAGDGGTDEISNAIPVCFECHAEIHSYNDQHPRGRKYRAAELKRHKEQWLAICEQRPETLLRALRNADVGPLQALVDELEFNLAVSQFSGTNELGSRFLDDQFRRGINEGAISTLKDELRRTIIAAYVTCGRANQCLFALAQQEPRGNGWATASNAAGEAISKAKPRIEDALTLLLGFLRSER